ncbi:MAG: hypothetical protein EAX87_07765 [Candidatus Thorarchaeota archaeon]|nr:hypothetical protein [Candidatus Thorarchaeota archaeon]
MATILSVFPVVTVLVAVVFAYLVARQWQRRHRIYQVLWFISLIMFAVAAGFEAYSEFFSWNIEIYKVYLVLSASLVAIMGAGALYLVLAKNVFSKRGLFVIDGILFAIVVMFSYMMTLSTHTDFSALALGAMEYPVAGIGTYGILILVAYILSRNKDVNQTKMLHGHIYLVFAIVMTLWMGVYAAVAQISTENFVAGIAVAGNAMPQHVRNFSPMLSVTGAFLLIGAAFFSFIKTRFNYNLWIVLGGLAISIAGAIARSGVEYGNVLYIGEVIGIFLLTKGFIDSDKIIKEREERLQKKPEE